MITTIFSDDIVNPSELRKNQKRWLDMAAKSPVSIAYGKHRLALLNREKIAELYKANYYLELAMKLCHGIYHKEKIDMFKWIEYLTAEEQLEFAHAFVRCLLVAVGTGDYSEADDILNDWKATAETIGNKKATEALKARHTKADYVELK